MPIRPWIMILLAGCGAAPAPLSPDEVTHIVVGPVASASIAIPVTQQPPPAPDQRVAVTQGLPLAKAFRQELLGRTASASDPAFPLFQNANLLESDGHLDEARKGYYQIITQFPRSVLVPYAYLGFADLFFDESDTDPSKLSLAQQAYEKVIAYPPPANLAYGYAWARIGDAEARSSEFAKAMMAARKAIESSLQRPPPPLADRVADSARKTLVTGYAAAGDPTSALRFFRTTDPANASALVVALGEQYAKSSGTSQLAALYDAALAAKDDVICVGAARIRETFHPQGRIEIAAVTHIESKRLATCGPFP